MGVLHKLVLMLHQLDPDNRLWKAEQRERLIGEKIAELRRDKAVAAQLSDEKVREQAMRAIDDRLREIEEVFDREHNFDDYARKLFLIENSIYGVDIQPIAVQIAKLRCFISLIIDQKPNPAAPNLGLRALPNLETKFVAANTLIGLSQQIPLKTADIIACERELQGVRNGYFSATTRQAKLRYQERDQELQRSIARQLAALNLPKHDADKLSAFNPYDQNAKADFFDAEWMFGIADGFDMVIGNPPYVQLQKDGGKLANLYKSQGYVTFERTGDIYALFYENGVKLLKTNGHLCLITSNKWMRAGYGAKLRQFFLTRNPVLLIDLGPGVFESATVDTNILLIQNAALQHHLKGLTLTADDQDRSIADIVQSRASHLPKMTAEAWFIGSHAEQQVKEKIERIGTPLKDWDVNIYYGIKTGLNEAFIIDTATKEALCKADPKSAEIIKPILRGRDIQRYAYEWAGLWLIFIPWHFPLHHDESIKGVSKQAEQAFETRYPHIYRHLLQFKPQLEQRNKAEVGIRYEWYALQRCAATYYSEFEKEKVVWAETDQEMNLSFVPQGMFLQKTCFMIIGNRLKFICGLLNSKISQYIIRMKSSKLGEKGMSLTKESVSQIPIPNIMDENLPIVDKIEGLVDQILAAKQRDPAADTRALETEIDRRVSALYGLTPEEIAIVEGKQ